jgi:hypothetical protein
MAGASSPSFISSGERTAGANLVYIQSIVRVFTAIPFFGVRLTKRGTLERILT